MSYDHFGINYPNYIHFIVCFCLALYSRDLGEEEDEGDYDDDDVEVHRVPGLLFRRPPQLLRYTAAQHSPYNTRDGGGHGGGGHDGDGGDYDNDEEAASAHVGELRLVSQIGTVPHTATMRPGDRDEIFMLNHKCCIMHIHVLVIVFSFLMYLFAHIYIYEQYIYI